VIFCAPFDRLTAQPASEVSLAVAIEAI